MIDPEDIGAMALFVAQAIHQKATEGGEGETWDDLTAEEQSDFLVIAHAAMGAHDGYLLTHGYTISKVNAVAGAASRKLVTPERRLIRPN